MLFLSLVETDEVSAIINGIQILSPVWDLITSPIVKLTYHAFLTPLTHVSVDKFIFQMI